MGMLMDKKSSLEEALNKIEEMLNGITPACKKCGKNMFEVIDSKTMECKRCARNKKIDKIIKDGD